MMHLAPQKLRLTYTIQYTVCRIFHVQYEIITCMIGLTDQISPAFAEKQIWLSILYNSPFNKCPFSENIITTANSHGGKIPLTSSKKRLLCQNRWPGNSNWSRISFHSPNPIPSHYMKIANDPGTLCDGMEKAWFSTALMLNNGETQFHTTKHDLLSHQKARTRDNLLSLRWHAFALPCSWFGKNCLNMAELEQFLWRGYLPFSYITENTGRCPLGFYFAQGCFVIVVWSSTSSMNLSPHRAPLFPSNWEYAVSDHLLLQ